MKRSLVVALCGVLAATLAGLGVYRSVAAARPADVDKAGVERARKTVQMLDDIYKNAIVLITDKYVNNRKDFAAGRAAVVWFKRVSETGHHKVRLIDVTGQPDNPANVANDDFEKAGVKQLKAGKPYYDEVISKDGKNYLRALTAVPVVMDKCVMCHPHYKDAKKGEAIGAISYTVPVE